MRVAVKSPPPATRSGSNGSSKRPSTCGLHRSRQRRPASASPVLKPRRGRPRGQSQRQPLRSSPQSGRVRPAALRRAPPPCPLGPSSQQTGPGSRAPGRSPGAAHRSARGSARRIQDELHGSLCCVEHDVGNENPLPHSTENPFLEGVARAAKFVAAHVLPAIPMPSAAVGI